MMLPISTSGNHVLEMYAPYNPTFIYKWGLLGYSFFLIAYPKYRYCKYLLEPPRSGNSNVYPQSMFSVQTLKDIIVYLTIFSLFTAIHLCILHGNVYVIVSQSWSDATFFL